MGLLSTLRSLIGTRDVPSTMRPLAGTGGWHTVVREPYTGAWQQNVEIQLDTTLAHPTVFACVSLISSDVAKIRLRLVEFTADGVWIETTNPAFSPVLRKPNRYQTIQQLVEVWLVSKLTHGNTYVLKQRDSRQVVVALYVLDPTAVCPLVTAAGDLYYELKRDDLAGVAEDPAWPGGIVVPASEIIHDRGIPLFHQLIGVSPIFACGAAALQGLNIQANSSRFFASGSNPGGLLLAPAKISDETAARLKAYWDTNFSGDNVGKVAILGDGLQYKALTVNPVDAQLLEQLKWTTETIAACFNVPAFFVDSSHQPPYANTEPLVQQYYSQCLQKHIVGIETALDEGLALKAPLGTEFDIDDLIWFDTGTRTKAASETIRAGALSPDEARKKYFGLGPVKGGDTPYLQQQMFSLAALAERDANDPFSKPAPAPAATPATTIGEPEPEPEPEALAKFLTALHTHAVAEGLYATG